MESGFQLPASPGMSTFTNKEPEISKYYSGKVSRDLSNQEEKHLSTKNITCSFKHFKNSKFTKNQRVNVFIFLNIISLAATLQRPPGPARVAGRGEPD